MATLLLQTVGGVLGAAVGGPFGAVAGRALGALGGAVLDTALLSPRPRGPGARQAAGRLLEADEGAGIQRVYGTVRVAGQVIWTTRFEARHAAERRGGKGGGSGPTRVGYSGNVAIGLCEGPIAGLRRVWADGEELDLAGLAWRLHRGTEDQMPDPLIEAKQGAGQAPAYRGLAYVVFERLPLERWGNRLPQIACEVIRPVGALENRIRAVTILPGATEHGLDPQPVRETLAPGEDRPLNRSGLFGETDFEAAIDEAGALMPHLARAALVTAWFGTDLRAGHCEIRPGVEVQARVESEPWSAGGVGRGAARLISRSGGGPAFGGTPSDAGVLRAIADLKRRGLKVTLYPFLLMDVPADSGLPDPYGAAMQAAYPWRGRLTLSVAPGRPGSPDRSAAARAEIAAFVGTARHTDFRIDGTGVHYAGPPEWSLRRMVLHHACLAKAAGGVDAFIIGSELRGLTRLRDEAGAFPFVAALAALAAEVKAVLPETALTYAADWSEYFGYQPADGSGDVFFNLDPLWAHPAIDAVGIDNYLPLADWRDDDAEAGGPDGAASAYDRAALRRGIAGGEYADWYYAGDAARAARRRSPITDGAHGKPWVFRPKDLKGWWSEPHVERRGGREVGGPSAWVPRGKPIWFTELGCPAVDKGANQPNLFVDPKSAESGLPYFSDGRRDDLVQRRFLEAHLAHWDPAAPGFRDADNPRSPVYGGRMVDPTAIHVWAYDARPFPAFPLRTDLWRDGGNWRRGHWLNGRLGRAPLDALIVALLADHGFERAAIDVEAVEAIVGGYGVAGPGTARAELDDLLSLCGVSVAATGGRLVFRSLNRLGPAQPLTALVADGAAPPLERRRREADALAEEIVVGFLDAERGYRAATAEARLGESPQPRKNAIDLPLVLEESEARRFAAERLAALRAGRETARFALDPGALALEPGDAVTLPGEAGRWLVTRIEDGTAQRVEARRLPEAGASLRPAEPVLAPPPPPPPVTPSRPVAALLDLPMLRAARPEEAPRVAMHARPFMPAALQSAPPGGSFETREILRAPAIMGVLTKPLVAGPESGLDATNAVEVALHRGGLASGDAAALAAGGNQAAIRCRDGGLEVLQFEVAEEVAPARFRLTRLHRAQGGTEDAMAAGAAAGAAFVLLDAGTTPLALRPDEIGRPLDWRIVPLGRAGDDPAVLRLDKIPLGGRAVRPFSPVNLVGRFEAGGDILVSFDRRTRTGAVSWDGASVPLDEEIERYRIRLGDGSGKELSFESPTHATRVTAAAQIAAFGTLPPRLELAVAQISLRHGPGTERATMLTRPAQPTPPA